MKNPHDVILRPIITERSMEDTMLGKYTFAVARDASKTEIGKACELLFEVKVLQVNTMNLSGKKRRMGKTSGRTASWKKAVVTIDLDPAPAEYALPGGKKGTSPKRYKTEIAEFGFGQ
ncbi:MAG TPA: 50S ribosomal protein L23 [Bacillota bacterium]|jgi:large subunit ribosomal protein L23|nr:50S ribosomal protein L23 [Fastidiosipila sp.]HPX93298.1 50S ribosomal protein L23 [Bacillota bacterium]HQB80957.1 50S ribosomal protein L23 [Bacillota bacterium]